MPSKKNIKIVESLTDKFSGMSVFITTDFRGMSVNDMTKLRQHLKSNEIEYRVIKNNLAAIAADAAKHPEIKETLEGSTGIAIGYGDPIQSLKTLYEYVKGSRAAMIVRAAILDGTVYRDDQLGRLTTLPSQEILIAQLTTQLGYPIRGLVTVVASPLQKLVTILNSPITGLSIVLQHRIAQKQAMEA